MDDLLKPKEIIIDSFFVNGKLKPELISDKEGYNILKIIKYVTDPVKTPGRNNKTKNLNASLKINQLRKYYDSFLKIYDSQNSEEEKKIQLLMLKANAEYSAKRLNTHRFNIFISNRLNLVLAKSGNAFEENIKALKLHLEALVAYYPKN